MFLSVSGLTKQSLSGVKFLLLAISIYVTVLFSTCIHFAFGPERTITLKWFTTSPSSNNLARDHFPDFGKFHEVVNSEDRTSSMNSWLIKTQVPSSEDFWKLSSNWSDNVSYILQVDSPRLGVPPFRYRFLPSLVVRFISGLTGLTTVRSFMILNVIITLLTASLFTLYLQKYHGLSQYICILGGVLFVTMVSNTAAVAFPHIEPASLFFAMVVFIAVRQHNVPLFVTSSLLGMAVKETLLLSGILWFLCNWQWSCKRKLISDLLISSLPFVGFVLIRMVLGGGALEVNYGFDLLKGDFPPYLRFLLSPHGAIDTLLSLFLSFSFLWFGLVNLKKDKFLSKASIVVPLLILATILFSGNKLRVLGVLFPIVIPSFLLFFRAADKNTQPHLGKDII